MPFSLSHSSCDCASFALTAYSRAFARNSHCSDIDTPARDSSGDYAIPLRAREKDEEVFHQELLVRPALWRATAKDRFLGRRPAQ
jgi:hypothetical protein